jgi:UDP-glucuronate 4-epimerase
MKVLVTGGAGFIGSHVSKALLEQGHTVAILDDLNDFYSPVLKQENLDSLSAFGAVDFYCGDLGDPDFVHSVFVACQPEIVIHLAARAGVRPSLESPLLYEYTNVRGTLNLLEEARRTGLKRFVFASSSSVYGIADQVPFREDDATLMPISPYAATKIAAEKLCYTYSHLYGIPVVCLRFFTVYGPRQRPDLAIQKFIERMDAGRPITMFGDGSMGRDYTYVDDTVAGVMAALTFDSPFEIFNLGNSHPILLRDMVREIEQAVGKRALVDHLPEQPGDVPITFADIEKARKLLGYSPQTPFSEGVARQVEWYRSRRVPQGSR